MCLNVFCGYRIILSYQEKLSLIKGVPGGWWLVVGSGFQKLVGSGFGLNPKVIQYLNINYLHVDRKNLNVNFNRLE